MSPTPEEAEPLPLGVPGSWEDDEDPWEDPDNQLNGQKKVRPTDDGQSQNNAGK